MLVETGLNKAEIGKLIMAATFVTDLGTVLALTLLFVRPTLWLLAFVGVSVAAIFLMQHWSRGPSAATVTGS